jgi:hypothetical protein
MIVYNKSENISQADTKSLETSDVKLGTMIAGLHVTLVANYQLFVLVFIHRFCTVTVHLFILPLPINILGLLIQR